MTVVDIPHASVDLAPGLPSRVVYGTVLAPTEDRGVKGGWIDFSIPGEIKIPGQETTITGRAARVPLNVDGTFAVRLPTASAGIEPEDWALSVKMSWRPVAFPMLVPTGEDPIWIEECLFPELVPGEDPAKYFLAGVQIRSVKTVGPDQPAKVRSTVSGGVLSMDWEIPRGAQGLPGATAVEGDEAVAAYVATPGESATKAALNERYAARDTAPLASRSTVEIWVSPTGDDTASGSQAAPVRTLAHAVSLIPDMIRAGHVYTINLLPGDWPEQLNIQNITILGTLIVQGSTSDRYAHTIRDARINNVQGHFIIRGIHSSKTVPGVHFWYTGCGPRMELDNVSGTGEVTDEPYSSGNQGVLADYGSSVIVENSKFDYKDYALRANYGSNLVSRNNAGVGNTHGVGARFGGRIEVYGTVPHGYDGTTTFSSGGTVVHETGGHVGVARYNQYLGKEDTHGLVSQHTLQGQGNISPTKQWVSRARSTRQGGEIASGGAEIPSGSTLRISFQMTTSISCTLAIDVMAAWIPVGLSGRRYIKGLFIPLVTQTDNRSAELQTLASGIGSGATNETVLSLGHTGADGVFYLDFAPNGGASNNFYGLDIRISNMRHYDAPIMLGAEVI